MGKWRARIENFVMTWAWRLENKVIDPRLELHLRVMKEMEIRGLTKLTDTAHTMDRQKAYDELVEELSERGE